MSTYTETFDRRGSLVEHHISAETLDGIIDAIKKVFAERHPLGYGTAVVQIAYVASPVGYEWNAVIRRAASCD